MPVTSVAPSNNRLFHQNFVTLVRGGPTCITTGALAPVSYGKLCVYIHTRFEIDMYFIRHSKTQKSVRLADLDTEFL